MQAALKDILGLNLGSWEEAAELLELAAKEWWYSGADMSTTASAMKGQSVLWERSLGDIADEMAATVQISGSGTTLGNLARAQSFFMPGAQQAGVSSVLANAVFATLTQLGVKPEQAGTRTDAVFRELADSSKSLSRMVQERTGMLPGEMDEAQLVRVITELYRDNPITGLSTSDEARKGLAAFSKPDMISRFFEELGKGASGRFDEVVSEVTESSEVELAQWRVTMDNLWNDLGKAVADLMTSDAVQSFIQLLKQTLPSLFKYATTAMEKFVDFGFTMFENTSRVLRNFSIAGWKPFRDWFPGFERTTEGQEDFMRIMQGLTPEAAAAMRTTPEIDMARTSTGLDYGTTLMRLAEVGRNTEDRATLGQTYDARTWGYLLGNNALSGEEIREMVPEGQFGAGFEEAFANVFPNFGQEERQTIANEQLQELRRQTSLLGGIKEDADPDNPVNCPKPLQVNTTYFSASQDVPVMPFR